MTRDATQGIHDMTRLNGKTAVITGRHFYHETAQENADHHLAVPVHPVISFCVPIV
jgi:hypothetical protein